MSMIAVEKEVTTKFAESGHDARTVEEAPEQCEQHLLPIGPSGLCPRCDFEAYAERCEQHGLPILPWGGCEDCEADFLAHEYTEKRQRIAKKWNIVSADEVSDRAKESAGAELVEGLIAEGSFNLLIGDSSLGKSPFLYQLALCVATGKPFLGYPVKQGDVLIVDFEDGYPDIDTLLGSLCRFLGLQRRPSNLQIFSQYGAPEKFGQSNYHIKDLIREMQTPGRKLTIVDTLRAYSPGIVEKNSDAATEIQFFREMSRISGGAFIGTHHLRKPSEDPKTPELDTLDKSRDWFNQASGALSLINGADTRLGVAVPKKKTPEDVAFVLRGFRRVYGELPMLYVRRVRDENGKPLGYERLKDQSFLLTEPFKARFDNLSDQFRHKDVIVVIEKETGKSPGAGTVSHTLEKFKSFGLIRDAANGGYEKVSPK